MVQGGILQQENRRPIVIWIMKQALLGLGLEQEGNALNPAASPIPAIPAKFKDATPDSCFVLHKQQCRGSKWLWGDYAQVVIGKDASGGRVWEAMHRLVLWAKEGAAAAVAEGKVAMHSCNNKKCINPHHLRWGSIRKNNRDYLKMQGVKRGGGGPRHVGVRKVRK
jgi:hypothetical protein